MAFGRLRLDHPEWVLYLSSDVGFGGIDQIVQPAIRRIRQKPAFAWSYRHPEFRRLACNIRSLGDALVAGVAVDDLLNARQQLGSLPMEVRPW
jgi:hypothetical protein